MNPVGAITAVCLAVAAVGQPARGEGEARIVFIAGTDSHGYGEHDFRGGARLLARWLNDGVPGVDAVVIENGWPAEVAAFDGAHAVVVYSDGLDHHVINGTNRDRFIGLHRRGVGLGVLHYACAVKKQPLGDTMLECIGGYYEEFWSVNPHWTADFRSIPPHPVTRGVEPFSIRDEWYYHLRFREDMKRVTPVLTAVPPEATRLGGDGAHSGNPHVRARAGMPEHVSWVAESKSGGRGFGITGLHYYWNLGHPQLRKLVLNACVWLAGAEVPAQGVRTGRVTLETLEDMNPATPDRGWKPGTRRKWEGTIRAWNR